MVVFNRGDRTTLANDRVLIGVFANETGDAAQDPLGKIVADWLTRGLHETGLVDVVDERNVAPIADDASDAAPVRLRTLARDVGAGLIVTGNYYLTGDSLQLQGQIISSEDGSIVRAIGPLIAAR